MISICGLVIAKHPLIPSFSPRRMGIKHNRDPEKEGASIAKG